MRVIQIIEGPGTQVSVKQKPPLAQSHKSIFSLLSWVYFSRLVAVVYSVEIYSKRSWYTAVYSEQPYTDTAICHMNIMIVNFMCQLDWVIGWPDIWSNFVLGVFLRVFLDEINILIGNQIALHNVGGPHPTSWRPEWNKKQWPSSREEGVLQQMAFGFYLHSQFSWASACWPTL